MLMKTGKYLGKKRHKGFLQAHEYILMSNGYVYVLYPGKKPYWLCTYTAWERTLHRVLS